MEGNELLDEIKKLEFENKALVTFVQKVRNCRGFGGAGEAYGLLTGFSTEAHKLIKELYEPF
jgi:hypothetical protein